MGQDFEGWSLQEGIHGPVPLFPREGHGTHPALAEEVPHGNQAVMVRSSMIPRYQSFLNVLSP